MPDYPEGAVLVLSKYTSDPSVSVFQAGDTFRVVDIDVVHKYWYDKRNGFPKEEWAKTHIPVMPIQTKEVMQHKYYVLEKRCWEFEVLPIKSQIDKQYEELYT